jgi:hypothetical protein
MLETMGFSRVEEFAKIIGNGGGILVSKSASLTPVARVAIKKGKTRLADTGVKGMGPTGTSGNTMGGPNRDAALADMIQGLRDEAVNRGVTTLMDEEVSSLGRS